MPPFSNLKNHTQRLTILIPKAKQKCNESNNGDLGEYFLACADAGGSVSGGRHRQGAHVDRMTGRGLGCASESELECTRRRNARTGGIDVRPNVERLRPLWQID